jgi:hypothetical protein
LSDVSNQRCFSILPLLHQHFSRVVVLGKMVSAALLKTNDDASVKAALSGQALKLTVVGSFVEHDEKREVFFVQSCLTVDGLGCSWVV